MLGRRLKQLRLARGFSLEALSAEMGGVVTKQALSKYELGRSRPSALVLTRLAAALGVKSAALFGEPPADTRLLAYRKGSRLLKSEQERIESLVAQTLEDRVRLEDLTAPLGVRDGYPVPVRQVAATSLDEAERGAVAIRQRWDLGMDPIGSVVDTLEEHSVHVITVDAVDKFDGLSAVAERDGRVIAAAVITRSGVPGERERLNLAHELGHLVLDLTPSLDEEEAAFRFGAAFLAPAESLVRDVGTHREAVSLGELLVLKQRYGMSIQALLRRLRDLEVIRQSHYVAWCREINRRGWRKHEPGELPTEKPQWLRQNASLAYAEGLISLDELTRLLGNGTEEGQLPLSLVEKRAFLTQSPPERRRLLAEQAETMAQHYEQHSEWRELRDGDVIDG